MLRVVLIEDEELILQGLTQTIDWLAKGCVIVGTALNGQRGLELIRAQKPDVVITDIMLPILNGLAMVEQAQQENLLFKTLFLSSYAEFAYARKAIDLQVAAYLLKPLNEKELDSALAQVRSSIYKEQGLPPALLAETTLFRQGKRSPNKHVQAALLYIAQHYRENLSVEKIAEQFQISPSYLGRIIKETTGKNFADLLGAYRIKQSLALLRHNRYKIYEISDLLGFSDYKRFNNVFKKYMGQSPSEYASKANDAGGDAN